LAVVNSFTDITERKRAEVELKESERRFREMLEKAELVAVTLDTQGRVTFINDYLLSLTGWQRDEVMGENWFDRFIPPEQQEMLKDFFFRSITTGEIQAHYTNDIVTSWDEMRTILFTNVLLRDLQDNITGTASIGEDITERERAAVEISESRRQVLDVLESITDGFVAVDNDWRFTYVNSKAEQLLGKRKLELLYRTMWEAFPEVVDTTFGKEFRRAVDKDTPVVFEEFYPPLNKWFEVHAFPYKRGLSIYFRDISKRKRVENEYKRRGELS
jgi:PAS domain S-box-containing protein